MNITTKRHCHSKHNMDRVSYLPDPIRNHIVSFLPLRDAIKTAILSKRWRDTSSSLSNLDFEEIDCGDENLKDIIDQILLLHDGSNIQSFKLAVNIGGENVSAVHLNRWISFALKHNVMELSLYVHVGEIEKLPFSLFTSTSLTTIELSFFSLKLPTTILFPVLKTLTLIRMTFSDEYLTSKLFSDSSCPLLESLDIANCYFDHFATLSISATRLKYLKLLDDFVDRDIKFNLSNPSLHKIYYECKRLPEISWDTLSCLCIATFELYSPPSSSAFLENQASKILMGMRNVYKLRLRGHYIQFLTGVQDLLACLPTSYCSLKYLRLVMDPTRSQLQVITLLLRSYPKLEKLVIVFYEEQVTLSDVCCVDDYWQSIELPTGDVLNHLRTVQIDDFRGSEWEFNLVSYLVENANTLKKVMITCINFATEKIPLESRLQISQKLLNITRASPHARILFS